MSEQSVSEEEVGTADVVDSASPIAGVSKGKRAASTVYTSRKHVRGEGIPHQSEPPPSTLKSNHRGMVVSEVDTLTTEDVEPHCSI